MIFVNTTSGPTVSLASDTQPVPIVDEASASVTYIGYSDLGTSQTSPLWRITRTTIIGTVTITKYADGDMLYDNIWVDRVTLTYSR
jgi:hypothetical protein